MSIEHPASEEIVKELQEKRKCLEHSISESTSECGDSQIEVALKLFIQAKQY